MGNYARAREMRANHPSYAGGRYRPVDGFRGLGDSLPPLKPIGNPMVALSLGWRHTAAGTIW